MSSDLPPQRKLVEIDLGVARGRHATGSRRTVSHGRLFARFHEISLRSRVLVPRAEGLELGGQIVRMISQGILNDRQTMPRAATVVTIGTGPHMDP